MKKDMEMIDKKLIRTFNKSEVNKSIRRYRQPDARRSWLQVINSMGLYVLMWILMIISLQYSYWITLLLAVPAAGFMIRIFIIFHDCGHGSFFKSQNLNDTIGIITGLIAFTPYYRWRHDHAVHHATAGDLDRRGTGDVWTLTVKEYEEATPSKKFVYRIARNPIIMFSVGALGVFLIGHRIISKNDGVRERRSVHWTNLALAGMVALMSALIGFKAYVLIQLPILAVAASAGVWLFYVQHQFEGVYWSRHEDWDYVTAALAGSSYYKLPKVLQWFSGNIGFHHIHHYNPRIPNYFLENCQKKVEAFQQVEPITMRMSLKALRFRLWDEEKRKLVGYPKAKAAIV
jgi:omega-6 fatty acid desaturase (delta-12 desaturase)